MKALLHELIDWLEACHLRCGPCGSPFEAQVESVLVAKASVALDWALASRKPVRVYTSALDPKPLLAAVISERARVDLEAFYRHELEDTAFPKLVGCIGQIAKSEFRLITGCPPEAVAKVAFFNGPLFAVFKT